MPTPITPDSIRRAPKVLLHDHLDGGLRPQTMIELADAVGYTNLPSYDPTKLGDWFHQTENFGSLERYLETFLHTCAVMRAEQALVRVAAEAVADLAADGVVYAEIRYAPELFESAELGIEQVIEAVQEGFRIGERAALQAGHRIGIGTLLCAMRQHDNWLRIAEFAIRYREAGVVGFDIAGPEAGYPPTRWTAAFDYLRNHNGHITIHAGEVCGLPIIAESIHQCGAERLGHGVRIVDDIKLDHADPVDTAQLGRLAAYVRDRRIALELCPTSNVQTQAAASIAEHPIDLLAKLRFRVTVNTDNRLMSNCTVSSEMAALVKAFGYDWATLQWFTINAAKSAFLDFNERTVLINEVIKPGFAALMA